MLICTIVFSKRLWFPFFSLMYRYEEIVGTIPCVSCSFNKNQCLVQSFYSLNFLLPVHISVTRYCLISACILAFVYLVFCVSLFCEWSKRLKKTIYAKVNVTGAFFQCMYTLSYIYILDVSRLSDLNDMHFRTFLSRMLQLLDSH